MDTIEYIKLVDKIMEAEKKANTTCGGYEDCSVCPHREHGNCVHRVIAELLIADNIGDVTEWKERAEKAEKERDEYRKSTHIALRGIEILERNILRYFATEFPSILQQAEREIEEEEGE